MLAESSVAVPETDVWCDWLGHGRHAGDAGLRARIAADTADFAARILDAVQAPPSAMLDLGCGEGLMAWAALARWPYVRVLCTDISQPLLAVAQAAAAERNVAGQCGFLLCGADHLAEVASGSQDLVTSRSVLAYVADKPAAFREACRVLRPGGTLSIAEPLFREEALAACAMRAALERAPNALLDWLHRWKAVQFPDDEVAMACNPLTNHTERDMLQFAREAGFSPIHLELHIDVQPAPPRDWAVFTAIAPHPLAPPLAQILAERFSTEEREAFEAVLRPDIEAGTFSSTGRMFYLHARKPG
ncbi:class I SAM-dependent methyltransferase [Acidocella sp.]|uniref:class I SAM-dependent methyltransferase n=1 Tax=Acidocella sp. TaxID=50710 RepID=UPI00262C1E6A|nr:class I SAM-dependent methyltransferase [Acidocella sp.]